MMNETSERAVWSGTIFGIRVHVLDDGRRIVDAEDLHRLLEGDVGFDLEDFGEAFGRFMRGETPEAST